MAVDLNLDGLFNAINSIFNIFGGIAGGVETKSNVIGQAVAILIVLGLIGGVLAAVFLIFRKGLGGLTNLGGRSV